METITPTGAVETPPPVQPEARPRKSTPPTPPPVVVPPPLPQQIHVALVAIGAELAKVGISKSRVNEQQRFRFRGIDDVMNTVSPILARHNVLFVVHYTDFPEVDRPTRDGKGALIYAKVRGDFTFISALDGSWVTVTTFGVAMDGGDKATNKAMSAALKYALLQTFLIPTESNEDADATDPEPTLPKPPAGFREWFEALMKTSDEGFTRYMAMWNKGDEPLRTYAVAYHKDELTRGKLHANDVSADLERQAAPAEEPEA